MLSSTASPKLSGPVSCPSSKTIDTERTSSCEMSMSPDGPKASSGVAPPQRNRSQPLPTKSTTGGGELQPTKYVVPSLVTTLNRGAPAPQCEPRGSSGETGLRMSYPSSVTGPLTSCRTAIADATFGVGPVFASSRPSFLLSRSSPVGHAGSAYGVPSDNVAAVGQPIPSSHADCTSCVCAGSNSVGVAD